jgi:hypothetical protein
MYRAKLRNAEADDFEGGEAEQLRLVHETERDYAALVSAGAGAVRLETTLERADREATKPEVDLEAILVRQLRELVAAVAASPSEGSGLIAFTGEVSQSSAGSGRRGRAYRPACSPCGAPGPGGSSISPRPACLPQRSQRRSGPMLPPQSAWMVSRGGPPGVG